MVLWKIFWHKNYNITSKPTDAINNRRSTSKWLAIFDHWALGKTVIITKEGHDWKWSLLWGGIEPHENHLSALQRELKEELWEEIKVLKSKDLWIVHTRKQINRILSVQLEWEVEINYGELEGIWFYPLEDKYWDERKVLESNMHQHAVDALQYFREKKSFKKYQWSQVKIPKGIFDWFHRQILELLKNQ